MKANVARSTLAAMACLIALVGCDKTTQQAMLSDGSLAENPPPIETRPSTTLVNAQYASPETLAAADPGAALLGSDQHDDLSLGKKQFRARNFGLAERYFRRAVEMSPRDAEAWVGLAASNDRLKKFADADRAYAQAIAILGPTPEILNNQGFSYLLRGDYKRAHAKFYEAKAKDPDNPRIRRNIELMEASLHQGKGVAAQ
jgi:Flp pilus assembly protein TadD